MIQAGKLFTNTEESITIKPTNSFSQNARAVVSCADSLNTYQNLPGETFQLIVSSPPYNLGKVYEKQTSLDDYLDWQAKIITELIRLLTPQGSKVPQS